MRKGDEKRQAILDVAEKLFYTKGYEATSVQDILDVLDTSKGSFYHHFESKEQVLATLCAQRAARAVTQAKEALAAEDDTFWTSCARCSSMRCRCEKARRSSFPCCCPCWINRKDAPVRVRYQDALREGFHDLMAETLDQCREAEVVSSLDNPYLPGMMLDLMNQCWMGVARELLRALSEGRPLEPGVLVDVMEMYRFALERILDAPYGAIELIRVPEMLDVLPSGAGPVEASHGPVKLLTHWLSGSHGGAMQGTAPAPWRIMPHQSRARDKLYCANAPSARFVPMATPLVSMAFKLSAVARYGV